MDTHGLAHFSRISNTPIPLGTCAYTYVHVHTDMNMLEGRRRWCEKLPLVKVSPWLVGPFVVHVYTEFGIVHLGKGVFAILVRIFWYSQHAHHCVPRPQTDVET